MYDRYKILIELCLKKLPSETGWTRPGHSIWSTKKYNVHMQRNGLLLNQFFYLSTPDLLLLNSVLDDIIADVDDAKNKPWIPDPQTEYAQSLGAGFSRQEISFHSIALSRRILWSDRTFILAATRDGKF